MFIGEYQHSIDEKGRLAIPVKFRKLLEKGAVVTRGLDGCLFVYPAKAWQGFAEKVSKLPISQSDSRAFSRHMLSGAMALEIDKHGRAVLPDYLRQFAGVSKKVVVAGLFDRVEIWDEDKWGQYKNSVENQSNEIAERMRELGI